ncbi:glutamine--fructose-6-phosphate transaminase (isomerizing) [bacterium]|jgi:glutamine---fructose-6-phosphate transaminase (isomerizing)|nr:glutamine--fructose-6-phosphate transaminase (isomerizing) [bacterium]
MCGIAGYIGQRNAVEVVLDQIERLEYRGYDSTGVAFQSPEGLKVLKRAGKLGQLRAVVADERPEAFVAIAHSRWATHGAPNDLNAHPHFDQEGTVAVIHNGIIENYLEIKEELTRAGHVFQSETDSEVAAHVIGLEYGEGISLEEAVRRAVGKLEGAFGFVVISMREPGKIVCSRNASPLVLGFGEGENFIASDIPALLPYTRRVAILDNDMVALVTKDGISAMRSDGQAVELAPFDVEWDIASAEKGGFEHFMLKEIHEQPDVVRQCLAGRLGQEEMTLLGLFSDHVWHDIDRVNIIACGTAYHAGLMGKTLFEKMLRLPTDVYFSSEFRYNDPLLSPKSLAVFVSQSGETADSLAALRLCKERRIRTLGIVNVVGSSIAREVDRVLYTQAGPEVSVASTKAYVAQCLVLYLLGLHIAQVKEMPGVDVRKGLKAVRGYPDAVQEALELESAMQEAAKKFLDAPLVFFLGRGADANVALEAALKLKEVAYVPTQECPAGEMKHGPLALIEEGTLAVVGATQANTRDKLASNISELQARGGHVLGITTKDDGLIPGVSDTVAKIPATGDWYLDALLSVVPLQLFSYYMALYRGCEIDQPRNLAKSVTVE